MDAWQKESLNLKVGDFIIWQDEAIEVEGQPALVTPGMKGEVISLHDGFHLDVAEVEPIPPKAIVQFDSGNPLSWVELGGMGWSGFGAVTFLVTKCRF